MVLLSRQKLVLLLRINHATLTRGRVMIKKVQEEASRETQSDLQTFKRAQRRSSCRAKWKVSPLRSAEFKHPANMQPNVRQMWL
jgi:hypothetical protein